MTGLTAGSHVKSHQQPLQNLARDVGQALVAAAVQEGEPGVFQAHQVQDRGVDVVEVGSVGDGLQADLRMDDVIIIVREPADLDKSK